MVSNVIRASRRVWIEGKVVGVIVCGPKSPGTGVGCAYSTYQIPNCVSSDRTQGLTTTGQGAKQRQGARGERPRPRTQSCSCRRGFPNASRAIILKTLAWLTVAAVSPDPHTMVCDAHKPAGVKLTSESCTAGSMGVSW